MGDLQTCHAKLDQNISPFFTAMVGEITYVEALPCVPLLHTPAGRVEALESVPAARIAVSQLQGKPSPAGTAQVTPIPAQDISAEAFRPFGQVGARAESASPLQEPGLGLPVPLLSTPGEAPEGRPGGASKPPANCYACARPACCSSNPHPLRFAADRAHR